MKELPETQTEAQEGFDILCNDNVSITISPSQVSVLQGNCDYFRSVFDHGTVESETRTIIKKDWSSTTARQLIELITLGNFACENLEEFRQLAIAADQVLVDIRILSPFTSEIMSKELTKKFVELSRLSNFVFTIEMSKVLTIKEWEEYLTGGILLSRNWDILVAFAASTGDDRERKIGKWYTHDLSQRYDVYATDAMYALQKLCPSGNQLNPPAVVKVLFGLDDSVIPHINVTVAKQSGGLQLMSSQHPKGWFLSGPPKMLDKAFAEARRYCRQNYATLYFTPGHKESDCSTVAFLNACLDCSDDKGTVCYIEEEETFIAVKTIPDTTAMLQSLAEDSPSINGIKGRFLVQCFENRKSLNDAAKANAQRVENFTSKQRFTIF